LSREFLEDLEPITFESILDKMVKLKVLSVEEDKGNKEEDKGNKEEDKGNKEEAKVKVVDDKMVTYLCSLCWPLVESYWVTIVYIF